MSERNAVLKAIQEELDSLANDGSGMESAPGTGVQSRKIDQINQFSKTEKKKGFKLSGGGQTVGGDVGGVTESADAIEKADGNGVASRSPQDVSGTDASGAPSNSGAEESEGSAVEKADGTSVASPNSKSVDGTGSGGTNAKAVNKAKGNSVASRETNMSERKVIILPHDTLVEDKDGNIKTIAKGTRVVIGENMDIDDMGMGADDMGAYDDMDMGMDTYDDMGDDMGDGGECPIANVDTGVDEALITKIVTAVVQALNGGGEYDYAMEGKEILPDALFEDVKRILESEKKRQDHKGKRQDHKGKSKGFGGTTKARDIDYHTYGVTTATYPTRRDGESAKKEGREKRFGSVLNERGAYCEDEEDMDGLDYDGGEDVDESSPDYIAGLIDDVKDDLEGIKDVLGYSDEEMEYDDEEMEYDDDEEMAESEY